MSDRGIRTTVQFNSKIYDHDGPYKHQWCSDPLENYRFDESRTSFFADNVESLLNEDGTEYTVVSSVNPECIVNLKIKRVSPGFQVGKNGTSTYGTDPAHPWGTMRHAFWPRCVVSGTMKTKSKTYDATGRGAFNYAIQGMKPHHAAARWNFINFQTPTYSAYMMEFTTPPSYGRTIVNVGAIAKDGEILFAGATNTLRHLAVQHDPESKWPEPKAILAEWKGKTKDGQEASAEIMGDLPQTAECVDVLAHIPGIIKTLIGGTVGIAPRIL